MNLQPLLTPCKGALADISVSVDPANPDQLQLYWGTVLLQMVPRDPDSLLFRMVAGLLTSLKVNMSSLEECLGVTGKTLRRWRDALHNGDWKSLAGIFHGPGAETKINVYVERYIRRRYRDAVEEHGKTPHGFRLELLAAVNHFWGTEISGESLRRIFRDEDKLLESERQSAEPEPVPDPVVEMPVSCELKACPPCSVAAAAAESVPDNPARDAAAMDREDACAFAPVLSGDSAETRNLAPEKVVTSSSETSCEEPGADGQELPPLFAPNAEPGCHISQHAGQFLLSPWFEEAFAAAPPIIRQTAAQILTGAVNQEQAKLIDYEGLSLMIEQPVCDIDHQQACLKDVMDEASLMDVFARNARLINLKSGSSFFVDPHHKEYTGAENVLRAWSGSCHEARKGVLLDCIHTSAGAPCFIGHFDNYDDPRDRFRLLTERFRMLFGEDACGCTWIHDRGYWARWFLEWIIDNGDFFIQWEKDYKQSGWHQPCLSSGRFTIIRRRNNSSDRIKVKVQWREQAWTAVPGGRRLIARIKRKDGENMEVAVVTNNQAFSARKVIELMLKRWLQENDFTYLARHFGIDELSGRRFQDYADRGTARTPGSSQKGAPGRDPHNLPECFPPAV